MAPVDAGFDGFVELLSTDFKPVLLDLPPVTNLPSPASERPIVLPTQAEFDATLMNIQGGSDVTEDPDLGHLVVVTTDCNGDPAADMVVTADPVGSGTVPLYMDIVLGPFGNLISVTYHADREHTNVYGAAGFVNLPPGEVTIRMTRFNEPQVLGKQTVTIRAGAVTELYLGPTGD